MAVKKIRPTNGVSFGAIITVHAADVSDGSVTVDFGTDYPLAGFAYGQTSSGIYFGNVTQVSNGVLQFSPTAPATLTVGDTVVFVAQRAVLG